MVIDEGICVYGQVRRIGLTDDVERAGRIEMRPAHILGRGGLDWGGEDSLQAAACHGRTGCLQAAAGHGRTESLQAAAGRVRDVAVQCSN